MARGEIVYEFYQHDGGLMDEVILGRKLSEKDFARTLDGLSAGLAFGETPVCAVRAFGGNPRIDTLIVTNQRIIGVTKGRSGAPEFAIPITEIRRLAFDSSKVIVRTSSNDSLEICRLSHHAEDVHLVRQAFASGGSKITEGENVDVVRDPSAGVQGSPGTSAKALRDGVLKVDTFLEDGERLLFALQNVNDWFFVTNLRFIVLTGIFKTKGQEMSLDAYVRVGVERKGNKWLVAAADGQQQYALLAEVNNESEARWLARSIESAYPHMADPWRDQLRGFIDSIGLSYASEALIPILWPAIPGEEILAALGAGEDRLIFTSQRAAVLPDLFAVPRDEIHQVVFAFGRSEHYAHSGTLLQVTFGMAFELRLVDGRRHQRVQSLGNSEQAYNAAIPGITRALHALGESGYQVLEGDGWLEQTQSAPPQVRRGGYGVEFEVEF